MTATEQTEMYADWIPIEEAAEQLGKSRRTLEREIAAGEGPETASRPSKGRPQTVCNPVDVRRLKSAAETRNVKVIPAGSRLLPVPQMPATIAGIDELAAVVQQVALCQQQMVDSQAQLAEGLNRVASAIETKLLEPAAAPEPAYLTVREAAALLGLSKALLYRLIESGQIGHILDWDAARHMVPKLSRQDCDTLRSSSQLSQFIAGIKEAADELRQVVDARKAAKI